jgi:hypothetical protein
MSAICSTFYHSYSHWAQSVPFHSTVPLSWLYRSRLVIWLPFQHHPPCRSTTGTRMARKDSVCDSLTNTARHQSSELVIAVNSQALESQMPALCFCVPVVSR